MNEKRLMWACIVLGILAGLGSIVVRLIWKNILIGSFLFVISIIFCLIFVYFVAKSQNIFWRYMRKTGWEQSKGFIIYMVIIMALGAIFHYSYPLITNEQIPTGYEIKLLWGVLTLLFLPVILMNIKIAYKTRNRFFVSASSVQLIATSTIILFIFGVFENMPIILFMCMMLFGGIFLGYLRIRKKYHVDPFGLYRNIVVKEGEKIDEHLDGYSRRPYSRKMKICVEDFNDTAKKFAHALGKEFIILDYDIRGDSAFYVPATNVMDLAIYTYLRASIDLFFNKKKFTGIKITKDGNITVFISKRDYERILEPVTYHTLCKNIAERFEQSFIEFAKGNKEKAIKILRGDGNE